MIEKIKLYVLGIRMFDIYGEVGKSIKNRFRLLDLIYAKDDKKNILILFYKGLL